MCGNKVATMLKQAAVASVVVVVEARFFFNFKFVLTEAF